MLFKHVGMRLQELVDMPPGERAWVFACASQLYEDEERERAVLESIASVLGIRFPEKWSSAKS